MLPAGRASGEAPQGGEPCLATLVPSGGSPTVAVWAPLVPLGAGNVSRYAGFRIIFYRTRTLIHTNIQFHATPLDTQ